MNTPNCVFHERALTVNIAVSPLQWGSRPGNLRFSLFTSSAQTPIGCVTIGGVAAYKMQKHLQQEGSCQAKVVRATKGNQYVLTHLATATGFQPWQEALYAPKVSAPVVVVSQPVVLPAARRTATAVASRLEEVVEV